MIRRRPWLLFKVREFLWRFNRTLTTEELAKSPWTGKGMWRISPVLTVYGEVCCYAVWRLLKGEARVYRDGLLFGEAAMLVDRLVGTVQLDSQLDFGSDSRWAKSQRGRKAGSRL